MRRKKVRVKKFTLELNKIRVHCGDDSRMHITAKILAFAQTGTLLNFIGICFGNVEKNTHEYIWTDRCVHTDDVYMRFSGWILDMFENSIGQTPYFLYMKHLYRHNQKPYIKWIFMRRIYETKQNNFLYILFK